jgi:multidrug resistance efflux pump
MKKIFAAVSVTVILAAVVFMAIHKRKDATEKAPPADGKAAVQVAAEGKVEAIAGYEIEVGSELEGKIAEIFVEEGDSVKKGDLIAQMENRDIQAKLKESEADSAASRAKYREVATGARDEELRRADAACARSAADTEAARREAERYGQLYNRGIVSRSSLDEMERAYQVAAGRQKEAEEERNLLKAGPKKETLTYYQDASNKADATALYYRRIIEKTRIVSPISGKVIRKYLQRGEMVSQEFQPYIVAVADPERVRINAEVDETDVGKFTVGDPAEVSSSAYPGVVYAGKVVEIADYAGLRKITPNNPAKNRDMKIVQVKIELAQRTPLKLGMTVDVRILPAKSNEPRLGS